MWSAARWRCGKPHPGPAGGPTDSAAGPRQRGHRRRHPKEGNDMIEIQGLTKRYGRKVAVDDLTFTVRPGIVTGFLGPNGAGKSTTMRMILGLDAPTRGQVLVNGTPYRQRRHPLREVGAHLDARAFLGGRSAYDHLLALAASNHIPRQRVGTVL